jgi:DNA ligase-1
VEGSFHPVGAAVWKAGQPVPYKALVAAFHDIEATTKRLEITEVLCNLFRSIIALTPEDLAASVYLACNKLAPEFKGVEIGLGDSLLIKALQSSMGSNSAHIKKKYEELGDLGVVANLLAKSKRSLFGFKPRELTVRGVLSSYREIAGISGTGSEKIKRGKISKMLSDAVKEESKYLVRGLQGKLRIGLAEQTVLTALAQAIFITPSANMLDTRVGQPKDKSAEDMGVAVDAVKQAFSECPSYDELTAALLNFGISDLPQHCHLVPGIPVKPMLAKPTKGVGEVLKRLEGIRFTCEWKYDGERGQVHLLPDGSYKIFSRNSEDNTSKYPDLIEMMPSTIRLKGVKDSETSASAGTSEITSSSSGAAAAKGTAATTAQGAPMVTSCIIDSEVIAFDRDTGRLLPFQVLSTRARKGATMDSVKVQVIMTAFDLLFLNGKSLLKTPLSERRRLLETHFKEVAGKFDFAKHKEGGSLEEIEVYLDEAIKGNTEGLMVKTLDENATYEPSKRSLNWLKLKKDYLEGIGDTLDLVPIGAYHGRGKRTGTYGAYLLACYNRDEEEFQTTCKIGTGFSDVQLKEFTEYFNAPGEDRTTDIKPGEYQVHDSFASGPKAPDVWLKPSVVWEVKAADLSISPVHTSAFGVDDHEKGIVLRFPRLERVRDDKKPSEATSAEQVEQMFHDQDNRS